MGAAAEARVVELVPADRANGAPRSRAERPTLLDPGRLAGSMEANASAGTDWSGGIRLLRRVAPYLIAAGRGGDLLEWTAGLPPFLAAREPWLLHYQAVGLRVTGDAYAEASDMQERARTLFAADGDRGGVARALAELATLACLRRRPEDARRYLDGARAELAALDSFAEAAVLYALADMARPAGPSPEAHAEAIEDIALDDGALFGHDLAVRARLTAALAAGRLTQRGIVALRDEYGLTPAETNVFVAYYLTEAVVADGQEPKRRALARELGVSENTLMHHVTSIRRKLGFDARKGSAAVYLWCLAAGTSNR